MLLFSLPSNVQFHCVWYGVMKLVIYLQDEENILFCGKQQTDSKNVRLGFVMCTLHIVLG